MVNFSGEGKEKKIKKKRKRDLCWVKGAIEPKKICSFLREAFSSKISGSCGRDCDSSIYHFELPVFIYMLAHRNTQKHLYMYTVTSASYLP